MNSAVFNHGPFQDLVGYEIVKLPDATIAVRLPIRNDHLNLHGVLHGGVLLTLLDAVGGRVLKATSDRIESVVTISMSTDFVQPIGAGVLYATASADKIGKTIGYVSMRVTADAPNGDVIARAHGSYRVFAKSLTRTPTGAI